MMSSGEREILATCIANDLYWNGQLGWTPALGLVREGGCQSGCPCHVERRVT